MATRVLVVDDAKFMRHMLKSILTDIGYEVIGEASDGAQACEMYKQLTPDIVTMDIVMPKQSGIDAVKGILEKAPDAKVVMCSALGQESLVMEALQAGARDFIVKPFKPENVLATLAKTLDKAD